MLYSNIKRPFLAFFIGNTIQKKVEPPASYETSVFCCFRLCLFKLFTAYHSVLRSRFFVLHHRFHKQSRNCCLAWSSPMEWSRDLANTIYASNQSSLWTFVLQQRSCNSFVFVAGSHCSSFTLTREPGEAFSVRLVRLWSALLQSSGASSKMRSLSTRKQVSSEGCWSKLSCCGCVLAYQEDFSSLLPFTLGKCKVYFLNRCLF